MRRQTPLVGPRLQRVLQGRWSAPIRVHTTPAALPSLCGATAGERLRQRDYGDESSLITAAREFSEETGKLIKRKDAEKLLKESPDLASHHCVEQGKYVLYVCQLKKQVLRLATAVQLAAV